MCNPPIVGDRVGVVVDMTANPRELLGYGVYDGDFIPSNKAMGELANEMRVSKQPCPRFRLDSGEVVWGCEAQWGYESTVKDMLDHIGEYSKIMVSTLRLRSS